MKNPLKFELRLVTPEMASRLLAQTAEAKFVNRPAKKQTIQKYANDMRNNKYHGALTGETVKLSRVDGKNVVVDGQHRLSAIVMADMPQELWICHNVPINMFQYIDGGQPRSLGDLMAIDGSPLSAFSSEFAVTGYMLYKEDHTGDPRVNTSGEHREGVGAQLEYIRKHYGDQLHAAMTANRAALQKAQRNGMGPVSSLLYFMVRANEKDPVLAAKVLQYFADFGEVQPCSKNLAMYARAVAEARKQSEAGYGRIVQGRHQDFVGELLCNLSVAWNLTREGTHLRADGAFTTKVNKAREEAWEGFK